MKPEEAINLLDSLISQMSLNRDMHVKAQGAVVLLRDIIAKAALAPAEEE